MRPGLPLLLLCAVGCGGATREIGDAGWGLNCYDAHGTYVGRYRADDDLCLYETATAVWKVDRQTGALRPVFDGERLALAFTANGCAGKEMVRCFEAPCLKETFVTWDGKVRSARSNAVMNSATLCSYFEPDDGSDFGVDPPRVCNDYRVPMSFLAAPLEDCPVAVKPVASFAGPLRRSP